jgi:hypothetical protein
MHERASTKHFRATRADGPVLRRRRGDEDLERGVAGSGTMPASEATTPLAFVLHGGDGVRHAEGEVVVCVDADLGLCLEHVPQRVDPVPPHRAW